MLYIIQYLYIAVQHKYTHIMNQFNQKIFSLLRTMLNKDKENLNMFNFLKKLFGFADVNKDGTVDVKDVVAVAETVKVAAVKVEAVAKAAVKPVAKNPAAPKKAPTKKPAVKKPAAPKKAPTKKPAVKKPAAPKQ